MNLPTGYRPEYHPATRSYIEQIESALKPLETISSRAGDEETAQEADTTGSVVGTSPLTETRW